MLEKIILSDEEISIIKVSLQAKYNELRNKKGSGRELIEFRQEARRLIGIITKIEKQEVGQE